MARNKQALRRTVQATADGYENFIARVGMQTPNQHSASTYRANFTSRNRMLVEWSYRSSWIIGEAVDAIPDDMTRKGIRITSEIDAKDRGILESQLDELQIWDALNDVLKWSRLYGGAAQLVYKAHLRTYSVEKLRELIALGGPAYEALLKNIDLIRQFQSNEGMTLMDSRDKFETHQYSFSGLDDILSQFAEQISGAVGIPLVRLFGQSPKGFSTGDADLANYYDRISSLQERRLRLPVRRILDIMHRSELGKPLPDDFTFEFNPLWQMSDVDRSTVALNTTNAISTALGDGLMTLKAAMTDLRENSDVTGIGASITNEDIENAEDEAPPGIGEPDDEPQEPSGGNPVSNQPTQDSEGGRRHRKWSLRWFK
ncbi:DUF1073 domain-containing protein [Escherichia coli]